MSLASLFRVLFSRPREKLRQCSNYRLVSDVYACHRARPRVRASANGPELKSLASGRSGGARRVSEVGAPFIFHRRQERAATMTPR